MGKTSLTASDLEAEAEGLEAEALAIRVKVHWAIGYGQGCSPRFGTWMPDLGAKKGPIL